MADKKIKTIVLKGTEYDIAPMWGNVQGKPESFLTETDISTIDGKISTEVTTQISNIDIKNVVKTEVSSQITSEITNQITNEVTKQIEADEISYSGLVDLKDMSNLTVGKKYRIIDYVTKTSESDTQSAGHRFDIIVTAIDSGGLSEVAMAVPNETDSYFADSNLYAWKIWYCLDNDDSRFSWADATNGRGVIYRMIDEFNNDLPYDFKNIQFKSPNDNTTYPHYYYTFASDNIANNLDMSVNNNDGMGDYINSTIYNNSIKPYIVDGVQKINKNLFISGGANKNIFNNNTFEYNCYSNFSFGSFYKNSLSGECYSNTFLQGGHDNSVGSGCGRNNINGYSISLGEVCCENIITGHGNSLGHSCVSNDIEGNYNAFGNSCSTNTVTGNTNILGNDCFENTIVGNENSCGNQYNSNIISGSFNSFENACSENNISGNNNSFGNGCYDNTLNTSCNNNSFENNCSNNNLSDNCIGNSFGNHFTNGTLHSACEYNSFGNHCVDILLGDNCCSNSFGNGCRYIKFAQPDDYDYSIVVPCEYYRNNHFGDGCQYILFTGIESASSTNQVQNYSFAQNINENNSTTTAPPFATIGGNRGRLHNTFIVKIEGNAIRQVVVTETSISISPL